MSRTQPPQATPPRIASPRDPRQGGTMSLVAIVNLAERLLNTSQQRQGAATSAKQSGKTSAPANVTFEDQFTLSAGNSAAQSLNAGLFFVNRLALSSAAANFLLAQPNPASAPAEETQPATKDTAPTAATTQFRPVNRAPAATNRTDAETSGYATKAATA